VAPPTPPATDQAPPFPPAALQAVQQWSALVPNQTDERGREAVQACAMTIYQFATSGDPVWAPRFIGLLRRAQTHGAKGLSALGSQLTHNMHQAGYLTEEVVVLTNSYLERLSDELWAQVGPLLPAVTGQQNPVPGAAPVAPPPPPAPPAAPVARPVPQAAPQATPATRPARQPRPRVAPPVQPLAPPPAPVAPAPVPSAAPILTPPLRAVRGPGRKPGKKAAKKTATKAPPGKKPGRKVIKEKVTKAPVAPAPVEKPVVVPKNKGGRPRKAAVLTPPLPQPASPAEAFVPPPPPFATTGSLPPLPPPPPPPRS